ncbi:MAG TPA: ATP-binding protein [Phycisphaerae bacterium]|nr:ATP-binding protein [Phycisphaerae bacterium]
MERPPVMPPLLDKPRNAARIAFRTSCVYLVFGLVWIVASDWTLLRLLPADILALSGFQTIKGAFFIFITAALLFWVVRHYVRALQKHQQEMQSALQGIAEQYQRLFERNPSAMLIFEPETRKILAANDVALLLYGFPRDELLAMRTLDLVVAEERPRVLASTNLYASGNVARVGPYQVRRRDGRIIFVDAITHQVEFNGKPARIALVSDITERLQNERALALYRSQLEQRVEERTSELSRANVQLRMEVAERRRIAEELRAATAAAEAANDAKSNFLANTSHEIRTPLTSILGYADLLAERQLEAADHDRYVDVVRQNAQHLLALIDDLLDLSRAEMGKVRVTFGEQNPREIAQQAIELLHPRAEEKELALILRIDPATPATLQTDGVRLRQILLNLVGNAIKFTTRGSVTLTIRPAQPASTGETPMLRFDVADTGIGMAPEHLQQIFEPFFQVDHNNTRRFAGFGLGLAISRQLAQQMGGHLAVQSTPGAGSTFSLELPLAQPGPAPSSPPMTPARDPAPALAAHVLIAEDTPNIRLLVSEYLTRAGARVIAVGNGQEAVDAIRQSVAVPNTDPFDLVILDLHMPILDGAQAMKQIKESGFQGPIVGLTADYAEKSADQWTREGWDAMAAKPIDRQTFIPLLARMVAVRHAAPQP